MADSKNIFEEYDVPNKITIFRFLLTPVIIMLLLNHSYEAKIASLVLFVIACITDKIDGTIARKYDLITDFGTYADPLADKLLLNSLLIVLGIMGILSWWMVLLIVLRESFIQVLRTIAATNKQKVYADGGRIKGPLQMATIIAAMYFIVISYEKFNGEFQGWMTYALSVLMIITLVVAYSAMFEFLVRNWKVYAKIFRLH